MPELPILYKPEMMQAKTAGIKTETRRTSKLDEINKEPDAWEFDRLQYGYKDGVPRAVFYGRHGQNDDEPVGIRCPYGAPGWHLWCKETWQAFLQGTDIPVTVVKHPAGLSLSYLADEPARVAAYPGETAWPGPWRSSLLMPRWASRMVDEVVEIRIERLHDITEAGAIAEGVGVGFTCNAGYPDYLHINKAGVCELTQDTAVASYMSLWDAINGKGEADRNPWCWVIVFRPVSETTGRHQLAVAPEPVILSATKDLMEPSAPPAPLPYPAALAQQAEHPELHPGILELGNSLKGQHLHTLLNAVYEKGLGDLKQVLQQPDMRPVPNPEERTCIAALHPSYQHLFNAAVLARTLEQSLPQFLTQLGRDQQRLLRPMAEKITAFRIGCVQLLTDSGGFLNRDGHTAHQLATGYTNDLAALLASCLHELNRNADPRQPAAAMRMYNELNMVEELPTAADIA